MAAAELQQQNSNNYNNISTNQEIPKVITFMSSLLQRVTESNDHLYIVGQHQNNNNNNSQFIKYQQKQSLSVFHGLSRPSISIQNYLERIFTYANCSPSCFVVAYVYLDRFVKRQPGFPINSLNVHRLLITSVLVSAKFMDDIYYNNAFYAKVGGISTQEMNILEVDFLFAVGFQLNVTPTTFHTYCSYLQREMFMQSPPPQLVVVDRLNNMAIRQLQSHCFFNEDDQSSHQTRLTV